MTVKQARDEIRTADAVAASLEKLMNEDCYENLPQYVDDILYDAIDKLRKYKIVLCEVIDRTIIW